MAQNSKGTDLYIVKLSLPATSATQFFQSYFTDIYLGFLWVSPNARWCLFFWQCFDMLDISKHHFTLKKKENI